MKTKIGNADSEKYNIKIRTVLSSEGEFTVKCNGKRYSLDGYIKIGDKEFCFEYNGCFWHGCPDCYNLDTVNAVNHKTFRELQLKTEIKKKNLESLGFNVITMRECDYLQSHIFDYPVLLGYITIIATISYSNK